MKDFHCCATCIHYRVEKTSSGTKRYCERLGYETNPKWQFNCWTPTETVKKLMDKQQSKRD
ncbi:hypothetical protein GLW08_10075 [Pontibacillus yanchengensis]|uniref:Uncharacterized protein n=2 Tax=Pontibacillus yanchengensis TaxID=462910 RepID=A0ACC7VE16_9BACI|nr:hypothetical protein [Pontibacillus yanchengensis]MYL35623.1 hypothetical protein [Pontibacillus yanchengensis]MYL53683.1 hypothetical protein [Pontibacillus yanchengensis]